MSVAVIGSRGQLGTDLVETLEKTGGYEIFPLSHGDIECTDEASARKVLSSIKPQVVMNCAAFVRVDECEDSPEKAFRVNSLGALYVARACAEIDALCGLISTDYVFDGEKGEPYTEDDRPHPINVYGTSKLAGEELVQQTCRRWFIARTASLFGKAGAQSKGGNFLETVISKVKKGEPLRVVDDIRTSPTYTRDAAMVLETLIRNQSTGIFHVVNDKGCSWFELAEKTVQFTGFSCKLEPIRSEDYSMKARRPRDSRLTSARLDRAKGHLRPWDEALLAYLAEKRHVASPNTAS
ncbi:MAG: dTDP-4-dehydrorhamnose reductase [Deltaproteobacteria bacterium]|nr:dTDP-4-dehydrorhamnose reductase [Deltaproteobacteria bacterium]